MDIYGLPNDDRTDIIHEFDNDDNSEKRIGGRRGRKFPVQWILDNGYIPYIVPVLSDFEIEDAVTIGDNSYTRSSVSKSEDYIRLILVSEVEAIKVDFINTVVPEVEHKRYIVLGARLNRKKSKFIEGKGPDLTISEEQMAEYLDLAGGQSESIHEAADIIKEEIAEAVGQSLIDFDVANHPAWGSN